jgi:hypothetical protein
MREARTAVSAASLRRRGLLLSYTPGAIAVLEGRNDTHMNPKRWLFEARLSRGRDAENATTVTAL